MSSENDSDSLICPITLDIFRDPVRADDGRLYERAAITRWINEHGTSPFTRQVLNVNRLRPDEEVRKKADQQRKLAAERSRQPGKVQLPATRPSRNVGVNSRPSRARQPPPTIDRRRSRSLLDAINEGCDSISGAFEKWYVFVLGADS